MLSNMAGLSFCTITVGVKGLWEGESMNFRIICSHELAFTDQHRRLGKDAHAMPPSPLLHLFFRELERNSLLTGPSLPKAVFVYIK